MHKAFQGANGWYVAWERADGFHGQPAEQNMTRREAEAEARRRNNGDGDGDDKAERGS